MSGDSNKMCVFNIHKIPTDFNSPLNIFINPYFSFDFDLYIKPSNQVLMQYFIITFQ